MFKRRKYMKGKLNFLLLKHKVQPVGKGYSDCIVSPENLRDFVNALTKEDVRIKGLTWWCHSTEQNKKNYGCPHGLGGPLSVYHNGMFSEMSLDLVEFESNNEVLDYVFNVAPNLPYYSPCFTPALWLDIDFDR